MVCPDMHTHQLYKHGHMHIVGINNAPGWKAKSIIHQIYTYIAIIKTKKSKIQGTTTCSWTYFTRYKDKKTITEYSMLI